MGPYSLILVLKHFVFPALLCKLIYFPSNRVLRIDKHTSKEKQQRGRMHVYYVCAFERVCLLAGF